jgi:hypothetical protein
MLFFIGYPAFGLLFMLEDIYETDDNMLSNGNKDAGYNKLNVIGHQ